MYHTVFLAQIIVQRLSLIFLGVVDMDGHIVAKLRIDLFERQSRSLGEVEVYKRDEQDGPADNDEVIFPSYSNETDRSSLE